MQGSAARHKGLSGPQQDQGKNGRRRLNEQNPVADGRRAIEAGNDDAGEEKYLDLKREGGTWLQQAPNQPGGKEPVIESLIGRKHGRVRGFFRSVSKCFEAKRPGPKEHFERKKINM